MCPDAVFTSAKCLVASGRPNRTTTSKSEIQEIELPQRWDGCASPSHLCSGVLSGEGGCPNSDCCDRHATSSRRGRAIHPSSDRSVGVHNRRRHKEAAAILRVSTPSVRVREPSIHRPIRSRGPELVGGFRIDREGVGFQSLRRKKPALRPGSQMMKPRYFQVAILFSFSFSVCHYLFCYDAMKINTGATPDGQELSLPPGEMKRENRERSCGDFETTKCALNASWQRSKRKPRP